MIFEIAFDTFTYLTNSTTREWVHIVVTVDSESLLVKKYVYPHAPPVVPAGTSYNPTYSTVIPSNSQISPIPPVPPASSIPRNVITVLPTSEGNYIDLDQPSTSGTTSSVVAVNPRSTRSLSRCFQ